MRTDPPVSVPIAMSTRPPATATADPLDDPPGMRAGQRGLTGVPQRGLTPVTPNANSCMFALPTIRQRPSASKCATTSA